MLNNKIQDALNEQINAELWSAYLYLSMGMHFEAEGMPALQTGSKSSSRKSRPTPQSS